MRKDKQSFQKGTTIMSFFEDFKRGATDAATKAARKTDEISNIVRLNVNVKTGEMKLSSVFEEIGRLFYEAERTGADYTSDIASAIMKADKIKADIENAKKQIAKLRKVTVCKNCGKEISDEVAFCPFCGAKYEKPEEECSCEETCCCEEKHEESAEEHCPCCTNEADADTDEKACDASESEESHDCGCCCSDENKSDDAE